MKTAITRQPMKLWQELNVSKYSEELKDKVRICMQLQRELDSYNNYYKMKMYLESLEHWQKESAVMMRIKTKRIHMRS